MRRVAPKRLARATRAVLCPKNSLVCKEVHIALFVFEPVLFSANRLVPELAAKR